MPRRLALLVCLVLAALALASDEQQERRDAVIERGPASSGQGRDLVVTVAIRSLERFYHVFHTVPHLRIRGFDAIYWLRPPSAEDMEVYDPQGPANRRVMNTWIVAVLPAIRRMHEFWHVDEFSVFEVTALLAGGASKLQNAAAERMVDTRGSTCGSVAQTISLGLQRGLAERP